MNVENMDELVESMNKIKLEIYDVWSLNALHDI